MMLDADVIIMVTNMNTTEGYLAKMISCGKVPKIRMAFGSC